MIRPAAPAVQMPDELRVLSALRAVVGASAGQVWTEACRRAGLAPPTAPTPEALQLALVELTRSPGVERVVAMSQLIRLRTARAHGRRSGGQQVTDELTPTRVGQTAGAARDDARADLRRLRAITDLRFGDPTVLRRLHELVEEASRRVGADIGMCNLVLDQAQMFTASTGIDGMWFDEAGGTPVEWSFCVHAVERDAPFVVEDATADPGLAENPMVADGTIRSYLGVPLHAADGTPVGALCTIAQTARSFTSVELRTLRELADEAERLLSGPGADVER